MTVLGNTALSFTEEQAMLLDVARDFCRDKSPLSTVREHLESGPGFDAGLWREIAELGWCGISLPESCGGSGLGVGALVPVLEAMGRAMLTTPLLSTALAGQLLLRAAGQERAESWLADIAAGSAATVAWLEGGDWGDPAIHSTVDAGGALSGQKRFVVDAGVAALILVPVMQGDEPALALLRREEPQP